MNWLGDIAINLAKRGKAKTLSAIFLLASAGWIAIKADRIWGQYIRQAERLKILEEKMERIENLPCGIAQIKKKLNIKLTRAERQMIEDLEEWE